MNRSTYADVFAPALKKLLWLGVAAAWIAFGLYVYKFVYSTGDWFVLSPSKGEWGTFGDYFGGLLNPFFSYLAFLGVLFTVILQARQLDTMRQSASHEEMQRMQTSIAERIDSMLSAAFEPYPNYVGVGPTKPPTIYDGIAALGTYALRPIPGRDQQESIGIAIAHAHEQINHLAVQTFPLVLQLESLSWVLVRYKKAEGDATVREYYEYRYAAVLVWLDALGLLKNCKAIHEFFKPKEQYALLTADRAP
jgi:hypothetical protein